VAFDYRNAEPVMAGRLGYGKDILDLKEDLKTF